ncbi:unnamed protein product [Parajaminaea phylloscopi]
MTAGCDILLELLTASTLPDIAALSELLGRAQHFVWPPMLAGGKKRKAYGRTSTASDSSSDPAEAIVPERYEALRRWAVLDELKERKQDECNPLEEEAEQEE